MTDLDDEAQCKIEEMMYNERQKKLGLPQSHEQVQNKLENIIHLVMRSYKARGVTGLSDL
jgi:hypothetical protein